jgi:hypothetical protein
MFRWDFFGNYISPLTASRSEWKSGHRSFELQLSEGINVVVISVMQRDEKCDVDDPFLVLTSSTFFALEVEKLFLPDKLN